MIVECLICFLIFFAKIKKNVYRTSCFAVLFFFLLLIWVLKHVEVFKHGDTKGFLNTKAQRDF